MHIQWASSASLCPQIRSRNPNEIIFGLNDGYYAADFDQKVQPFVHFPECLHHNGISSPNLISCIWTLFGFCTETSTCACSRISRSGRKTVCFRSTRVQSGTPTVFSLCSGKNHVMQQAVLHHINQLYYIITMQQPNCFSSEVFSLLSWISATYIE